MAAAHQALIHEIKTSKKGRRRTAANRRDTCCPLSCDEVLVHLEGTAQAGWSNTPSVRVPGMVVWWVQATRKMQSISSQKNGRYMHTQAYLRQAVDTHLIDGLAQGVSPPQKAEQFGRRGQNQAISVRERALFAQLANKLIYSADLVMNRRCGVGGTARAVLKNKPARTGLALWHRTCCILNSCCDGH